MNYAPKGQFSNGKQAQVFAVAGYVHCRLVFDDGLGDVVCGANDEGRQEPGDHDKTCGVCMLAMLRHLGIDPQEFIGYVNARGGFDNF